MYLAVNSLIETFLDNGSTRTDRVLHVDRYNDQLTCIKVPDETALPVFLKCSKVQTDLNLRRRRVLEHDPWLGVARDEDQLSEAERIGRDRAWSIIEPIVQAGATAMHDRKSRGRLVAQIVQSGLATKPTVYAYLRRFWQGGQCINALIPRFANCGASGKARTATAGDGKKRGRPSLVQTVTGETASTNVDERIQKTALADR